MTGPHNQQPFQQNMGQVRHGPSPNQGQGSTNDPQLSQFTLTKGRAASWEDAEAQQQHVSLESLQRELDTMQRRGVSIQRTLNEIPSDNARTAITDLLNRENQTLWTYNQGLKWIIAGMELEWKSLDRKYRQLKRISVILRTEPHPYVHNARPLMNKSGSQPGPHDHTRSGKNNGVPGDRQFSPPDPNVFNNPGQNQHMGPPQGPVQGQGQDHGHGHGHGPAQGPGPMHGPPNPTHPPPHPTMQPNVPQHMSAPPPPPPPHHPPHQHDPRGQGIPQQFPGVVHEGQRFPIEILDAQTRKKQKATPKKVPGGYFSDPDSDSDTDSDSSAQSFSAESAEDDIFNVIKSRSHSRSRNKSRGQESSRPRSQSRHRISKTHKDKISHTRARSNLDPPPFGKHHEKSRQIHSPKSSTGNIPPQQIHIEVNTGAPDAREQDRGRNRDRDHSVLRYHNIDRHHKHDRSLSRSRQPDVHAKDYRRSTIDRSLSRSPKSPRSPRLSYDRIEKDPYAPQMYRTYSSESSNGTDFSDNTSSIVSDAGESVFTAPYHLKKSRHNSIRHVDHTIFPPPGSLQREKIYPASDRHSRSHHAVDDYPSDTARHHRSPPVIYHGKALTDDRWSDENDSSIASWPQTNNHRRKAAGNPFDSTRYPPQRSLSYAEHNPAPAYPYYPAPKALPERAAHDPYDMHDIVEAGVEALREKKMNAYDHIHQGRDRHSLKRSNTLKHYDAWANHTPAYNTAPTLQKARLPNGRYVDVVVPL